MEQMLRNRAKAWKEHKRFSPCCSSLDKKRMPHFAPVFNMAKTLALLWYLYTFFVCSGPSCCMIKKCFVIMTPHFIKMRICFQGISPLFYDMQIMEMQSLHISEYILKTIRIMWKYSCALLKPHHLRIVWIFLLNISGEVCRQFTLEYE